MPFTPPEESIKPDTPQECGWVEDSKGNWHQYAHPSNNLTRDQYPHCTTKLLASKKPESTVHHIWRRFVRGEERPEARDWEESKAKTALYKRHLGLKKAERDFKKYEKKMLKNKHVEYTPVADRQPQYEYYSDEDGGDGYRPPPVQEDPGEGTSAARDQSLPPPYPLKAAGLAGEKESTSTQEETRKRANRHATLHDLGAASVGIDMSGHQDADVEQQLQQRRETVVRDDAPAIPPGW